MRRWVAMAGLVIAVTVAVPAAGRLPCGVRAAWGQVTCCCRTYPAGGVCCASVLDCVPPLIPGCWCQP